MKATLTSKGQVTIPKPVRDYLHLQKSDTIDFKITDDGRVLIEKPEYRVSEAGGMLAAYTTEKALSTEQINEIIRAEATKRNQS